MATRPRHVLPAAATLAALGACSTPPPIAESERSGARRRRGEREHPHAAPAAREEGAVRAIFVRGTLVAIAALAAGCASSPEADRAQARIAGNVAMARAAESERERLTAQSPREAGLALTLGGDLLFDVGEAALKPGGRHALGRVALLLREQPERTVVIEGFADATGGEALNRRLSQERADAVKRALIDYGIDASRLIARGLGHAFPVATNDTVAGRQLNRRVEIVLVPGEGGAAVGATRRR